MRIRTGLIFLIFFLITISGMAQNTSVSITPTPKIRSSATATLSVNAPLVQSAWTMVFQSNFDNQDVSSWSGGAGWGLHPLAPGQALRVYNSDIPFILNTGMYTDVATEAQFVVDYGTANLSVRQSTLGGYTASLDRTGRVNLLRGSISVSYGQVAASTPGQWRKLRVYALGNTVYLIVDDVTALIYQDTQPLPAGKVSFNATFASYTGRPVPPENTLLVDNFRLYTPATATNVVAAPAATSVITQTTVPSTATILPNNDAIQWLPSGGWTATERGWTISSNIGNLASDRAISLNSMAAPRLQFRYRLLNDTDSRLFIRIDNQPNWLILKMWAAPVVVSEWTDASIDLSPYQGEKIWLQFAWTALTPGSSWSVENIRLVDAPPAVPRPADLNSEAAWDYSGSWRFDNQGWLVNGRSSFYNLLTYHTTLDLTRMMTPQLRFESLLNSGYAVPTVQVAVDGGEWQILKTPSPSSTWTEEVVGLSAYIGRRIRLRFTWKPEGDASKYWRIRNIRLSDASIDMTATALALSKTPVYQITTSPTTVPPVVIIPDMTPQMSALTPTPTFIPTAVINAQAVESVQIQNDILPTLTATDIPAQTPTP